MSFLLQQGTEIRVARAEELVDGRKRLIRFISFKQNSEFPPQLTYAYGDADPFNGTVPSGWSGLLLVKVEADSSPANNGAGNDPVLQVTYETPGTVIERNDTSNNGALLTRTIVSHWTTPATPSGYTLVSTNIENVNGFPYKSYTFAKGDGEISRNTSYNQSGTTVDGTLGVTRIDIEYLTAPGAAEPTWSGVSGYVKISVTNTERDGHEGWSATFAKGAGTVSQTDESRNGGDLLLRTIVALGSAPATPSGYTSVSEQSRQDTGHIVYTYQFAKGDGEISRAVDYSQSEDQGATGVTRTTIRYLTAPAATVQPTTLAGSLEIGRDYQDLEGHRMWTTTWAKGTGLVAQNISARQDGLREVTNVALGTRSAPVGIVIRDDYRIEAGFKVYTVTSMQTAAGGSDPTVATVVFERYVPFTYPGRAKAFEEVYNSRYMMDVFEGPPITTLVKATVTVSYTATATLGTISDFWNPSEWATIRAQWIGLGDEPQNLVRARPGYRSTSSTPITRTSSSLAPNNVSIFGNIVYGNTTAKITVTGGPADPGGSTFTLSAELEPAFTDAAGTKYYRKTLVSAAIPAQAALPV